MSEDDVRRLLNAALDWPYPSLAMLDLREQAPTIAAAYIEQAATIARLTEERDRLREALRNEVVRPYSLTKDYLIECRVCRETWSRGNDERHALGCLAALKEG